MFRRHSVLVSFFSLGKFVCGLRDFARKKHLCASSGVPCGSPGAPWSGVPGWRWTVTSVRSECFRFNVCFRRLLADSEFADHVAIAVRVVRFQVIQQAAALAYQHQQSTPGCMILLVGFEMLGKVVDPLAQNRDLELLRTGVRISG